MRDLVEIGIGKVGRRAYELDDVEIVPSRRTRSSMLVSTGWQIDAYPFELPFLTHPTDAVSSPDSIIAMSRLGGLGVLDAEGLWSRHADPDKELAELAELASGAGAASELTERLQQLQATAPRPGLLAAAVAKIRDAGVTVAARVSPQHARELTPELLAAGVELLVVQGTIISAEHVIPTRSRRERAEQPGVAPVEDEPEEEPLNLKEFIADLDVPVIAGGVGDHRTALHLMRTGAAGVIVGYGAATPSTTDSVLGIGVPMATAIADAAAARREYLDETGGRYVHVIANGGVHTGGDVARSIACGADAVMLGEPLARCAEAPGRGLYWTPAAGHPSLPRSAVLPVDLDPESTDRATCPDLETVLLGPSTDPWGAINLGGALRRAMAKTGYSDLKEFQKVHLTVRS